MYTDMSLSLSRHTVWSSMYFVPHINGSRSTRLSSIHHCFSNRESGPCSVCKWILKIIIYKVNIAVKCAVCAPRIMWNVWKWKCKRVIHAHIWVRWLYFQRAVVCLIIRCKLFLSVVHWQIPCYNKPEERVPFITRNIAAGDANHTFSYPGQSNRVRGDAC